MTEGEASMDKTFDMAIIGGGPGGYVAAIRGAQLGKRVALIESQKLGGTCVNWGCIPAKYLLHQTHAFVEMKQNRNLEGPLDRITCNWRKIQEERVRVIERLVRGVEFLLSKNGVRLLKGKGKVKDRGLISVEAGGGETEIRAEKIILAAGSRSGTLPFLAPNGKEILTSREALELPEVPGSLVVIGAGAVGLEMGTIYRRMGAEVIVLEIMPTVLPGSDTEMATRLERILKVEGLEVLTQMSIESCQVKGGRAKIQGKCLKTQLPFVYEAEKVLLAVGRDPSSDSLCDERLNIERDKKGFVKVNARLETSIPGVFAIGDLIGGRLLAHKAFHEGILAAENCWGAKREMKYGSLPMAVHTEPEFSSVGLTQEEAIEKGHKAQVGLFALQANGRALTMGKQEGMVKIVADEKDRVIGAHIIAPHSSEFISEMTLAISRGLKVQDISSAIHIHPTLSEAVMEAALKVKKEAIHVLNT